MNPIHFDLTFLAQSISFLLFTLLVFGLIHLIFFNRPLRRSKDISEKLDHIIQLLEKNEAQR